MSYTASMSMLRSMRQMTAAECLQVLLNNKLKALGVAVATLFGSLLAHNLSIRAYRRLKGIPPSPIPLPFIGLSFYFATLMMGKLDENGETKDIFLGMHAVSSDLGDIQLGLQNLFGSGPYIVIANSRLLRKLMTENRELATSRCVMKGNVLMTKNGEESIFNINGQKWVDRRKLFVSIFTKMLTTKFMNKVCRGAIVNVLFPEIDKVCIQNRKPISVREQMQYVSFNAVFYANFNRFYAKDDEFLREFRDALELANELALDPTNFWKQTQGIPLGDEVHAAQRNLSRLTQQIMAQRRKELKEQKGLDFTNRGNPSAGSAGAPMSELIKKVDFDSYLDYLLKLVHEGALSDDVAEVEVLGVFSAAGSNVAFALEWVVVLCAKFASTQKRIRQELYRVHGVDPKALAEGSVIDFDLNKANQCALLRAFVYETLRWQPFARNGPIREVTKDTTVEWKGARYVLPKGAVLGYQIEFMQRLSRNEQKREFKKGESLDGWLCDGEETIAPFCIENWLDEEGNFRMNRAFCAFGFGRRDCPGKAFALKSMMINLGYLIMNYSIEFGEADKRENPEQTHIRASVEEFMRKIKPEIPILFSKIKC